MTGYRNKNIRPSGGKFPARLSLRTIVLSLAAVMAGCGAAHAQDEMTLAVGQRGNWDTSIAEIGQRSGIFARHGLELEILYTQGGGETLQTVISGAVDVGVGPSVMAVLGAFDKGAPVRIIGAEVTGATDLFWYVRSDSSLQSVRDIDGQTIAYSTTGASTHEIVKAYIDQYGIDARPTPVGSPPSSLTQVMAGLIDVGWSAPPFGLAQLDAGDIRIIGSGSDATRFAGQTVRVLAVNARRLNADGDKFERFMRAYRETIDYMYDNPQAMEYFAEFANVSEDIARRTRDDFFPKEALDPDRVLGLERSIPLAIELRYLGETLSDAQLAELIRIPPRD
jgi:NitT/TauT family transport system substrate-binding protein